MGYAWAGFDVVGVDHRPQPRFPFEFVRADALDFLAETGAQGFDAIHASPPCQAYSVLRRANPGAAYPDLVAPTRSALEAVGLPWIIENVPGAPLRYSIFLCGSMFGLEAMSGDGEKTLRQVRQLRRHRLFETSFPILQPSCQHRGEALGVYGGGPVGRYTFENGAKRDLYRRRGGYQGTVAEKARAMGIDWARDSELAQAIPPAYTEFLAFQLLDVLAHAA